MIQCRAGGGQSIRFFLDCPERIHTPCLLCARIFAQLGQEGGGAGSSSVQCHVELSKLIGLCDHPIPKLHDKPGDVFTLCIWERPSRSFQPGDPRALDIGHGFTFRLEGLCLIALRGLHASGMRRQKHPEALDVRQPASGKHAVAHCEILAKGVDDVGDRLVVGRGRDDHRRLVPVERSLYPEPRYSGEQHRRLAGPGRAVDRDHLAGFRSVEPGQDLPLLFGQGEVRVRMPKASRKFPLDAVIHRYLSAVGQRNLA